jgi:hypothetical protein
MLILTNEMIRSDLAGYQGRLQAARDRLAELPTAAGTWPEQKKLKEQKRILRDEIKHVRYLMAIATEALSK